MKNCSNLTKKIMKKGFNLSMYSKNKSCINNNWDIKTVDTCYSFLLDFFKSKSLLEKEYLNFLDEYTAHYDHFCKMHFKI